MKIKNESNYELREVYRAVISVSYETKNLLVTNESR